MAKKIKADALASEVMKELDDYSSLTTEVMKGGQECRKNSPGGDCGHSTEKDRNLWKKLGGQKDRGRQ